MESATAPPPLRRSLLFVPGGEPRKLEKAAAAAADTVILDLEDAVAPERKAAARDAVTAALRGGTFAAAETAVRVNAPATPYFEADLEAVIKAGAAAVLLPKAENAERIAAVAQTMARVEREHEGSGATRLLLLVESPAGITAALALGGAAPRVEGLCFGHADFALGMGLTDADASCGVIYHARCSLVIAAKACGVAPIDSVYLAVKDEPGFRADAELGMRLGFEGKLCIHPRQVEIANAVYTPSPQQVEYAARVVAAWQRAQAEGRGVFTLDEKMVDAPVVAVQQRVLARARRAGLAPK